MISSLVFAEPPPADDTGFTDPSAGDDYFMAPYVPKVKSWLALVELGHANERVWKLFRSGDNADPLQDTQYALVRFPNHPRALNLLVEIAKAMDRPSLPLPYFERALKYYPQHAFTHAQYGHYLVDIGATSAGIAELTEALRMDPRLLQARAWLDEVQPRFQSRSDSTRVAPTGSVTDRTREAGGE